MTIKLNKEFEYATPDAIAECTMNCPKDLYTMLWGKGVDLMAKHEQKFAESCGYRNIGEWKEAGNTPTDYMCEINISAIWEHFTDEEKTMINDFAEIVQW